MRLTRFWEEAAEPWSAAVSPSRQTASRGLQRSPGPASVSRISSNPDDRCVFASERDGLFPVGDGFVRAELMKVASVEAFMARRRHVLGVGPEELKERGGCGLEVGRAAGLRRRLRGGASEGVADSGEPVADGGDFRTLAIDHDGQGERYKNWRTLCIGLTSPTFQDWPLEGPRTAVHLCKHMGKHGSLPSGFLDRWCRPKRVEEIDRV